MSNNKVDILQISRLAMQYATERQAVLSRNVQNANVPHAKAQDLAPFNFKRAVENKRLKLLVDQPGQIESHLPISRFRVIADPEAVNETPDGNNIDLPEQIRKMSDNSINYQEITNIYKKMIGMLKMSIGNK